ncbi:MAG: hypothetical protein KatS3mg097_048 [Candidatus Parcubacteria bacterium]|nr:MAG: hypothetical protein KatS3mg097_048 [Candidatus Parcubacteria bacterium]
MQKKSGFTLIEILLVIGIIAILAGALIVAINPGRQLAKTRDTQRTNDVQSIASAISQLIIDKQTWNCPSSVNYSTSLPVVTVTIIRNATETSTSTINLDCLTPNFLPKIPVDPSETDANATQTRYTLTYSSSSMQTTICANGELKSTICVTK